MHSSKLQSKLEKLARWRVDPSLIEFPTGTREFHGGFATVSQAFLASASESSGARAGNGFEDTTPGDANSNPPNFEYQSDAEEGKDGQRGGAEEDVSGAADGEKDAAEEDRRKASHPHDELSHLPTPITKVGDESDTGDRSGQSQLDTRAHSDDHQGSDEGRNCRKGDGDKDETREAGMEESINNEEGKSHPQPSISTITDEPTSPGRRQAADQDPGTSNPNLQLQNDAPEHGGDQQGKDKEERSHVADVENTQTEEERNLGRRALKSKGR
ncbi:hypothetical protein FRC01_000202 [Tulasnella sp. 417]|nr:hypothetical protein FRC01_000202 [Tulasnella sp. 417]